MSIYTQQRFYIVNMFPTFNTIVNPSTTTTRIPVIYPFLSICLKLIITDLYCLSDRCNIIVESLILLFTASILALDKPLSSVAIMAS